MSEAFDHDRLSNRMLAPMTREGEPVCADWAPSAAFLRRHDDDAAGLPAQEG